MSYKFTVSKTYLSSSQQGLLIVRNDFGSDWSFTMTANQMRKVAADLREHAATMPDEPEVQK